MRRTFITTNGKDEKLATWRRDMRQRALGLITACGGAMSGKELGQALEMSPRGLRSFFSDFPLVSPKIVDEIDTGGDLRGNTWYVLNLDEMRKIAASRPALPTAPAATRRLSPPVEVAATIPGNDWDGDN